MRRKSASDYRHWGTLNRVMSEQAYYGESRVLNARLGKQSDRQTTIAGIIGDKGWAHFLDAYFLPSWIPVLLGLVLGVALVVGE